MSVLRTMWNTRAVYLLTLLLTLAWGISAGWVVATMTQFVLGPFGGEADAQHALAHLVELVTQNPELAAGLATGTVVTAVGSWIAWTVFGGAVFFAARGDSLADSARGAVHAAAPLAVQGLVHAVLTTLALLVLSVVVGPLPAVARILGLVAALAIAVLARDLTRAQICLHGLDKPYHPRATLRSFVVAAKRPREVAITAGMWAAKMAVALALIPLAIRGLGPDNAGPLLHVLTALGLALSIARLAWVTRWTPVDLETAPAAPNDGAQTAET